LESIINIKKRRRSKLKFSLSHRLQELKEIFIANGGEFKECKIGDFFLVEANPQLNKESFVFNNTNKYPYFTRTMNNNGILGYVDYLDEEHKIKGNSIAVGMLGMRFFYMERDFYAGQFTKTIFPKFDGLNETNAQYFISWFNKLSTYLLSKLVRDFDFSFNDSKIELPIINGKINLEFMETYISELERERISELDAYLEATELNNTILSEEENAAINEITNGLIKYKEFKIGDLFEKINTIPLKYKVNDLPKEANSEYNLPALTAGIINQGLSCFVKRNENYTTILKNVISVSANGANSGAMFYQDCEFTVLQDAYAIRCIKKELDKNESLYFLSALQKVIKGNFNWVNKAGWHKIKNYNISLPITEKCDIDFDFMEKYIRAIEKKAIKGVVDWKDKVIAKTKEVVAFSDKDNSL
jgi:hypothetical protein